MLVVAVEVTDGYIAHAAVCTQIDSVLMPGVVRQGNFQLVMSKVVGIVVA